MSIAVNERPIIDDMLTNPTVNSTQMRQAMRVVYEHMHRIRPAGRDELMQALDVMEAAYKNTNWVEYVP